MGFFVLDLAHAGDVVIGATGTGIAPIIPMLDELTRRTEPGRIDLYWGLRTLDDAFYLAELSAFRARCTRFSFELCITRPPPGWQAGHVGRITARLLDAAKARDRPVFYLVGSGDMVKEMRELLPTNGVDRKRQIRTEAFFPAHKGPP
jgi:ferredoxin-NADP reductase